MFKIRFINQILFIKLLKRLEKKSIMVCMHGLIQMSENQSQKVLFFHLET